MSGVGDVPGLSRRMNLGQVWRHPQTHPDMEWEVVDTLSPSRQRRMGDYARYAVLRDDAGDEIYVRLDSLWGPGLGWQRLA